jgi:hypothetical protein
MTRDEIVRQGRIADDLLNNPVLEDCFEQIRKEQFKKFEESTSSSEREEAHLKLQGISALKTALRKLLYAKQCVESKH